MYIRLRNIRICLNTANHKARIRVCTPQFMDFNKGLVLICRATVAWASCAFIDLHNIRRKIHRAVPCYIFFRYKGTFRDLEIAIQWLRCAASVILDLNIMRRLVPSIMRRNSPSIYLYGTLAKNRQGDEVFNIIIIDLKHAGILEKVFRHVDVIVIILVLFNIGRTGIVPIICVCICVCIRVYICVCICITGIRPIAGTGA